MPADYRKVTTFINRALLICSEKEDTAMLRYLLESARTEFLNLANEIEEKADKPRLH